VDGQDHAPAALSLRKHGIHLQEAGRAPGTVWMGTEKFFSTESRSPDRPARSRSLYYYASPTALYRKEPCRNRCISDYSTEHWARSSSVFVPSASWRSFRNASHSLVTLQQRRNQPLPPNVQRVWVVIWSSLSTIITCDSYSSNGDTQHNNSWSSHGSPPSHHMYRYMEQPWLYHIPRHSILTIK